MKRQTHSLNPFVDQHQDLRLAVCVWSAAQLDQSSLHGLVSVLIEMQHVIHTGHNWPPPDFYFAAIWIFKEEYRVVWEYSCCVLMVPYCLNLLEKCGSFGPVWHWAPDGSRDSLVLAASYKKMMLCWVLHTLVRRQRFLEGGMSTMQEVMTFKYVI